MSDYTWATGKQRKRVERYDQRIRALERGEPLAPRTRAQSVSTLQTQTIVKTDVPEAPTTTSRTDSIGAILGALKVLFRQPELSAEEREMLERIRDRYEAERARAKQTSPDADNPKKIATKAKGAKLKSANAARKKEQQRKIEETHKVSGFGRGAGKFIQGGAPGLGKRSS